MCSYSNQSFTIEIISNGPYLTSNFLEIKQDTNVNIIWEKYIDNKKINLGNFKIEKDSIIDITHKFSPDSRNPHRALKINNFIVNENQNGTSSDKYIVKFTENTKFNIKKDYYVDH